MARSYRTYSDEDLRLSVKESNTLSQVLKRLGLRHAGGNYDQLKKNIQTLGLSVDHFTGKAWSKDQMLKDWSSHKSATTLKRHLLKAKGKVCECCKNSEWMGKEIPLEIHHVDGDGTNNSLDNLQILCCNCHALTPNWRNKNRNVGVVELADTADLSPAADSN